MKFTPKTDRELEELHLLQDGEYSAEVIEAIDTQSKTGLDMIALKISVNNNYSSKILNDWLLESFPVKLKHFCKSCNILEKYDSGDISAKDCIGKKIKVKVTTKADENGKKWNRIEDYLEKKSNDSLDNKEFDDSLPF